MAACFPCLKLWSCIYLALPVMTLSLLNPHMSDIFPCCCNVDLYSLCLCGLMTELTPSHCIVMVEPLYCNGWSVRLSQAACRFDSRPFHCHVTPLGKLLTHFPLSQSSIIGYRCCSEAWKITANLVEYNGIVPPGLWLCHLFRWLPVPRYWDWLQAQFWFWYEIIGQLFHLSLHLKGYFIRAS